MDPTDPIWQPPGPPSSAADGPPPQGSDGDREVDYVDFAEVEPDGPRDAVSPYQ
jgi:hypothetical protein